MPANLPNNQILDLLFPQAHTLHLSAILPSLAPGMGLCSGQDSAFCRTQQSRQWDSNFIRTVGIRFQWEHFRMSRRLQGLKGSGSGLYEHRQQCHSCGAFSAGVGTAHLLTGHCRATVCHTSGASHTGGSLKVWFYILVYTIFYTHIHILKSIFCSWSSVLEDSTHRNKTGCSIMSAFSSCFRW